MILADPKNREQWLRERKRGIGASEAGCIIGANPWKNARHLWEEKTGRISAPDLTGKPAIEFGKNAESHVRELFLLQNPEYKCEYHEFRMYCNFDRPYIFATLDGELWCEQYGKGIYEGKTTEIQTVKQWEEWDDRIPQHYYVQCLHQMAACSWAKYVVLNAFIKYTAKGGKKCATVRPFTIFRKDVECEIDYLIKCEERFWEQVQNGDPPPDILPEI